MNNLTNHELQFSLSDIALSKLDLVPTWVQKYHPKLNNSDYEVFEGGQITLIVRIARQLVIKIFVPKFNYINDYDHANELIQNYIDLQNSDLDLGQFGIIYFDQLDPIFGCPIVVCNYYADTQPLVYTFYTLDSAQRSATIAKVISKLKDFNQPASGFTYSTQRILDEFDRQFQKFGASIPTTIKETFVNLRLSLQPRTITEGIHLVHGDIHLENILVNETGDFRLIDFDFCHFAPLFVELEIIFLFCFLPTSVVPDRLKDFYSESMPEVFDQFVKEYPELCDSNYQDEIKLMFASEIIPKIAHPKFEKNCYEAIKRFF